MQRCELAAQSTKHGNKQCLCLRSPCSCAGGRFSKLKYKPRTCAHDAHQRGVLRSAAIDLARRRRRNFARRHNDSCKMTYARMGLWKRGPGSLIAAAGLQKLASSQHGGWLAEDGRGANCRLQRRQALPRAQRARRCDAPLPLRKAKTSKSYFLFGRPRGYLANRNGAPPHHDFRRERQVDRLRRPSSEIPPFNPPF